MAVRVVEGVPGSGKSYYFVYLLASDFCVELKTGGYTLNPDKKVRVVTNISSLKLPHENFQTCLDEAGGFEQFFTKEYQAYFSRGWRIVYIIDEAQEWFHPKYCKFTKENLLYFTWARHEGHDIWLGTQNIRMLAFEVACLSEFVVQAQPRSNQVSSELTYIDRTFDGTELRTHRLVFSKKIGALYQSEERKEATKIKNHRMRKYLAALLIVLVLSFFSFRSTYRFYNHFMHPEKEVPKSSAVTVKPAPAASGSVPVSSPASPSLASTVSGATKSSEPQVEWYMYKLDYAVSPSGLKFLLGLSWIPAKEFPYKFIKKGDAYFAMIPAVLLPALENGSRALPIRTGSNSDKG